jgi:hypothetical protein
MIEPRLTKILLVAGLSLFSTSNSAAAQRVIPPACCHITVIDTSRGVVSATIDDATGTFSFKFDSGTIPSTLKVGQHAWLRGDKVSLDGTQNCCTIVPSTTSGPRVIGIRSRVNSQASYSSDSAAHARECDQVAQTSFPQGGHTCMPRGALVSSGKSPDGSEATYRWTCSCT